MILKVFVMKNIPFNKPTYLGQEEQLVLDVIGSKSYSGSGKFSKKCTSLFNKKIKSLESFFVPSGTAALEMALMLIDIKPGDEVILPSYTFSSCATAVVLHGGTPVFVDSSLEDFNISIQQIIKSINKKTKAIMVMHYGGVACEMEPIMEVTKRNKIFLIEDAAQSVGCFYKKRPLGSFGDLSAFSFHETKNINCGEGGILCINNKKLLKRAYFLRDKGTNRESFINGDVNKYSWVDKGSSYLVSEFQAAFLFPQLKSLSAINKRRISIWNYYKSALARLEGSGHLKTLDIPGYKLHNGHIFSILLRSSKDRDSLIAFLKKRNIATATHYVPLHSSKAGKKYGKCYQNIKITNQIYSYSLRLPIFDKLTFDDAKHVIKCIESFFGK